MGFNFFDSYTCSASFNNRSYFGSKLCYFLSGKSLCSSGGSIMERLRIDIFIADRLPGYCLVLLFEFFNNILRFGEFFGQFSGCFLS